MPCWRPFLLIAAGALVVSSCVKHPTEPKEPPTRADSCCNSVMLIIPYDSASGAPVVGASVRLQKSDRTWTAVTDSWGALFRDLCPGTYSVRIASEHCSVRELSVPVECNSALTLRVPLRCERDSDCCRGILSFSILDSLSLQPLPQATVRLWRHGTLIAQQQAQQGIAVFDNLCAGEYMADIVAEGYQPKELPVRVECRGHVGIHILLSPRHHECCEGELVILVRDSSLRAPIAGARVRLWREGRLVAELIADLEGRVEFKHLCRGLYGISVHAEGYTPKEFTLEVGCNEKLREHAWLSPRKDQCCQGSLTAIVLDAQTRNPIKSATVRLWVGSQLLATESTNEHGEARFERLCNRRYGLSVHHPDYQPFEQSVELECNERVVLYIALQRR